MNIGCRELEDLCGELGRRDGVYGVLILTVTDAGPVAYWSETDPQRSAVLESAGDAAAIILRGHGLAAWKFGVLP